MKSLSQKIIEKISKIQFEELPKGVVDKAKLCIIHEIACTYAGNKANWSQAAQKLVHDISASGASSIWFCKQKSNAAEAAFVNAVMSQSILHEDIHRDSNTHPGIIIIPAVIALGEQLKSNGKAVLTAIVAGYEMMGRIGRGTVCPEFAARGFRPTSIIGALGSAVAAGILLNLDLDQQISALGLSGNFTSGINEWAHAGSDDLYFQNGMASRHGIIAASLAKYNISASKTILEGKSGLCRAYGLSEENLKAVDLDDGRYIISEVLFKPAPACALTQTTAQVALDVAKAGVNPEDIIRGEIRTFALGKNYAGCDYAGPFNTLLQARMSNQFNFAASLINKKIANQNYLDFEDPTVCSLASKLEVVIDSEITEKFPGLQPVEVYLELKNGNSFNFYREEPVYLKKPEILEKLYSYCTSSLLKNDVDHIVDIIEDLEKLSDIRKLTSLLTNSKVS